MKSFIFTLSVLFLLAIACTNASQKQEITYIDKTLFDDPRNLGEVEEFWSLYNQTKRLLIDIGKGEAKVVAEKNGLWGIVDTDNNCYLPFEYEDIFSTPKSLVLKKQGRYLVYDQEINFIAEVEADGLEVLRDQVYVLTKASKKTLMSNNGQLASEYHFEEIEIPRDGTYFLGKKEEIWNAYNIEGGTILKNLIARQASQFLNEYRVGLKEYGPIKIGMRIEDVEKVLERKLNLRHDEEGCNIYDGGSNFLDIDFLIEEKEGGSYLERIYFRSKGILTRSGIGIGSTQNEVIDVYGSKIQSEQHEYVDNFAYLYYVPTDEKDKMYRLNFTSDGTKVLDYSVGRIPAIRYVEGCL